MVVISIGLMIGLVEVTKWFTHLPDDIAGAEIITRAECAVGTNRALLTESDWAPCDLPDNWDVSRPDFTGDLWYRFRVGSDVGDKHGLGLLLGNASMNAAVFVNNFFIGSGGHMHEPVARNWNRLLYFFTPTYLLLRGQNEVLIHVRGYANSSSGLGCVYAGPDAVLKPAHLHSSQASDMLSKGAFALAVAIGLLFVVLWLLSKEHLYLFFGAGSLISSIYIADVFIVYIPTNYDLWEWAVHSSIMISQALYLVFMLRVLKLDWPALEKFALVYVVAGTAGMAIVRDENMLPFAAVWEGISLLWVVFMIVVAFRAWLREGKIFQLLLAAFLTWTLLSFAHDWLPWVLGHGVAPPFLFYLGPMGFTVVMALLLMTRLIAAIRSEKEFSLQLQQSLDVQRRALEAKHLKVAELEQERVIKEEQRRIVRELHDGVGGHIAAAMAMAGESMTALRETLTDAMDDLRTIMDSLDAGVELHVMLGMMRLRLENRLGRHKVKLDWQVMDMPEAIPESPQAAMHLVRIIQEAVANSLKHAAPKAIRIRSDKTCLQITDDGCGFDPAKATDGRGLKNIRWRAEQIGAIFTIVSDPEGTSLRLCWAAVD